MLTSFSYYDLIETLPERGCAVCNLIGRDGQRQIDTLLGEFAVDIETHRQLRASRGLCNDHAWRLMEQGEAYVVSLLYNSVLDEVNQIMQHAPRGGGKRRLFNASGQHPLSAALEAGEACIVCAVMKKSEGVYLRTLGEQFGNPKLKEAFRASDGLCLAHFRGLLDITQNQDFVAEMVTIQRDIWQRLKADLELFMQQLSMPGIDPHMGPERDSWKRTVARMSGEKGIF